MRPLTFSRPKPLMPILNKPVTAHILEYLSGHGIKEAAITTNYLREHIKSYFGDEYAGIKLTYPQENEPLGTAGSVKNIEDYLDETFVVVQGDTITDLDLKSLVATHKSFSGLCTIAAYEVKDPWNFGVMELGDDGHIRRFHEKPKVDECQSNLVNTGLYVLEPEVLDYIPPKTFWDFSKDLFPLLVERQSLFAVKAGGFWVDIGQPSGYTSAKKWLMSQMKQSIAPSADIMGRIDGPAIIGEGTVIGRHSHLIGPVVLGANVTLSNGVVLGPNTTISDGVHIGSETIIHGAVVFERTVIGQRQDISQSFIDEKCRLGQGGVIQSNVMIGNTCQIGENVAITNGSRIWPNMGIEENSLVSGTLKRFIPSDEIYHDPKWILRSVHPDQAFYFNKAEGGTVSYTGHRALSLWEFKDILKNVDNSSIDHHMRLNVNDFQQWFQKVVGDKLLSKEFMDIKNSYSPSNIRLVRHQMLNVTEREINRLIEEVKRPGYV